MKEITALILSGQLPAQVIKRHFHFQFLFCLWLNLI